MMQGVLGLVGILGVLASPLGYRSGLPLGPVFLILLAGLVACAVSLALATLGVLRGTQPLSLLSLTVLAAAALVASVPVTAIVSGRGLPLIHDVTTDTDDPPQFVAIVPLREDAPNRLDYAGSALAAAQTAAYPDLGPLRLLQSVAQVVSRSEAVANALGWEVVAADSASGRLEATDATFWYGFKDDVVVRVTPADDGAVVDVRSVSRVGQGDLGANAKRIRRFLDLLRTRDGG